MVAIRDGMPVVLSVKASRTPGLRVVLLEDGRRFRLPAEVVHRWRLEPGSSLTQEQVEALGGEAMRAHAQDAALRLLAVRARSAAELTERLRRRGIDDSLVRAVVADLRARGYLDDESFALEWVRHRLEQGTWGIERIRWELRGKGIPPDLVERAIRAQGGNDPSAEEERRARAAALRQIGRYAGLAPPVRRRRLAAFLQRRGFSPGTIARIVRAGRDLSDA